MVHDLEGKVIAIPSSHAPYGTHIVESLLKCENRVALGAPAADFQMLDARIDGRDGVFCQPVDLDRETSANTFFQIAFAQLGPIDIIVLEMLPAKARRMSAEKAVGVGTRRLLHCLNAALPYVGDDLHLMCIAPAYGPAAIPITTSFLAAKIASSGIMKTPRVRMSVVSPPTDSAWDDAAFARSIVHLLRETRSPDVTETVLPARRRGPRQHAKKISLSANEKAGFRLQ